MAYDDARHAHGSAKFATRAEIARAGMFRQTEASMYCLTYAGRPLWFDINRGGVLVVAGARGGKGVGVVLPQQLYGIMPNTTSLILCPKGEGAAVARDQTPDGKACIYWNATGMHGLPQHRVNPVGGLNKDNPNLVADAAVFARNLCPRTPGSKNPYFEDRAQQQLTGIMVGLAVKNGVLTLPDLYDAVNDLAAAGERWLDTAYALHSSGYDIAFRVEEELAAVLKKDNDGSGAMGILGEMLRAVGPLSDPRLRASLSAPFDFTLDQLCRSDQFYQVYLMPPLQSVSHWAPILRCFFVGAMLEKAKRPDAPRQFWSLDECGNIGAFPLMIELFTMGSGLGITLFAVFQSSHQMDNLGSDGRAILTSGAALQVYFSIRDFDDAKRVSDRLGMQTLHYNHALHQGEAAARRKDLLHGLMNGADPFELNARKAQLAFASEYQSKERRLLRTPDEILHGPENAAYVFADGVRYPILAEKRRYFEERMFAHRYHPNPFFPPTDRVQIKTLFGTRWRPVITAPVPERFAHLPQYQDGLWSYIGR
ncbi:type IV secretory system conjugative DNA transfer family protein [uncultured Roseobacter sp.]|uniref:type IV secretory system conjugative DNA transfer family protein n=1 Tax=uncultured Roseobacter sp. TaxID=114847 RepID=UPI0026255AE2|nr:type IV secretory system conjugative DNA transfer family protein [uncultured Roseobacter sp.]